MGVKLGKAEFEMDDISINIIAFFCDYLFRYYFWKVNFLGSNTLVNRGFCCTNVLQYYWETNEQSYIFRQIKNWGNGVK